VDGNPGAMAQPAFKKKKERKIAKRFSSQINGSLLTGFV
jgi:hypothetical protein